MSVYDRVVAGRPLVLTVGDSAFLAQAAAMGLYAGAAIPGECQNDDGVFDMVVGLATVPEGLGSVSCEGASDPACPCEWSDDLSCWVWSVSAAV